MENGIIHEARENGNGVATTKAARRGSSVDRANEKRDSNDKENSSRSSSFEWRECWRFTGPGFLMSIA